MITPLCSPSGFRLPVSDCDALSTVASGTTALSVNPVGVLRRISMPGGTLGFAGLPVRAVANGVRLILGTRAPCEILDPIVGLDVVQVPEHETLGPGREERRRYEMSHLGHLRNGRGVVVVDRYSGPSVLVHILFECLSALPPTVRDDFAIGSDEVPGGSCDRSNIHDIILSVAVDRSGV